MVNSPIVLMAGLDPRQYGPDPATHGGGSLLAPPPKMNENPFANEQCCRTPPSAPASGGIAQLVERRLCKPDVAGSSPTASTSRAAGGANDDARLRRAKPTRRSAAE